MQWHLRIHLIIFAVYGLPVALACAPYPWTLFLEKPPGLDVAEAKAIRAATQDRVVLVGLNRRFMASTQTVLKDLGPFDEPRFITVQDQQSLATARAIGHAPAVVDHWMYANSIHLVDYLRFLGRGPVLRVVPVQPWSLAEPGVVIAQVRFASGDVGLYQASRPEGTSKPYRPSCWIGPSVLLPSTTK